MRVNCQICGAKYDFDEIDAGTTITCTCGNPVLIPIKKRPKPPSQKSRSLLLLVLSALGIGGLMVCVTYALLKTHAPLTANLAPSAPPPASSRADVQSRPVASQSATVPKSRPDVVPPDLRVTLQLVQKPLVSNGQMATLVFQILQLKIVNHSPNPVIVRKVLLNGEYDAPIIGKILTMPITLTIGDSAEFEVSSGQHSNIGYMADTIDGYKKEIVFVDVETDDAIVTRMKIIP